MKNNKEIEIGWGFGKEDLPFIIGLGTIMDLACFLGGYAIYMTFAG